MPFFPETNYDFPNVSEYDGDLRELLEMYQKVTHDYAFLAKSQSDLNNLYVELKSDLGFLTQKYNAVSKKLDAYIASNDTKVDEFIKFTKVALESIKTVLLDMNSLIADVNNNLMQEIANVKTYSNAQNDMMRLEFQDKIENVESDLQKQIDALQFKLPKVFNPAQGQDSDIQSVLDDFWRLLRYGAYTAQEFTDAGCESEELDSLDANAIEWDANGKILLYKLIGAPYEKADVGIYDSIVQLQLYCDSLQEQIDHIKGDKKNETN